MAYVGQNSTGYNWQGTVQDLTTGQTTIIATINVPISWGYISNSSVVWTEDFGLIMGVAKEINANRAGFSVMNMLRTAPAILITHEKMQGGGIF